MDPQVIKHEERYRLYLQEVESLAADDPAPDSPEGARLTLLATWVEDYEKDTFRSGTT